MQQIIKTEVAIIGGSNAGLAAALTLGRAGRNAIVFDTGKPRNKPAAHAQNFFTRDGTPPAELLRIGREQLVRYPTIQIKEAAITQTAKTDKGFSLQGSNGETYHAQRIIIATGVKDQLPEIPGMAELWGNKVIHCPYCHGWEIKDLPVAVFANGDMAYEAVRTIINWHKDMVICTNGAATIADEARQHLSRHNIPILETPVEKIEDVPGGILITFADGTAIRRSAAYVRAKVVFHNEPAVQLGCELTESGAIKVNEMSETTVPGVFAAGDVTTPMQQVSMAAATGHLAGAACNNLLTREEFERG